jgi:hypothetical protein
MNQTPEAPILSCLRLLKALNLSRHGKMRAAQALLAAEETMPQNLVELHALAALVTSEGDYPRALRLWRLLLDREPRHPEAGRMIASIELWISRPPWVRYVPAGALALVLAIVGAVIVFSDGSPPPSVRTVRILPSQPAEFSAAAATPAPPHPQAITIPGLRKKK